MARHRLETCIDAGYELHQIARDLDVPITRINGIIKGKRAITADTALRLGKYFGVSPQWWLNMQSQYDLEVAEDKDWPETAARIRPLRIRSDDTYRPNA